MGFQKGISGNLQGRTVGKRNKITAVQRQFIQSLLDGQQAKIKEELTNLQGKDYLAVIVSLLKYVVPQKVEIEMQPVELLKFGFDDERSED